MNLWAELSEAQLLAILAKHLDFDPIPTWGRELPRGRRRRRQRRPRGHAYGTTAATTPLIPGVGVAHLARPLPGVRPPQNYSSPSGSGHLTRDWPSRARYAAGGRHCLPGDEYWLVEAPVMRAAPSSPLSLCRGWGLGLGGSNLLLSS